MTIGFNSCFAVRCFGCMTLCVQAEADIASSQRSIDQDAATLAAIRRQYQGDIDATNLEQQAQVQRMVCHLWHRYRKSIRVVYCTVLNSILHSHDRMSVITDRVGRVQGVHLE